MIALVGRVQNSLRRSHPFTRLASFIQLKSMPGASSWVSTDRSSTPGGRGGLAPPGVHLIHKAAQAAVDNGGVHLGRGGGQELLQPDSLELRRRRKQRWRTIVIDCNTPPPRAEKGVPDAVGITQSRSLCPALLYLPVPMLL